VRWDATLYKEEEQALFPHERSCSESTFVRMSRNRGWRVNNGVHAARARAAARQHCDMNACFERDTRNDDTVYNIFEERRI
jgi:hypothetical protein